MSERPMKSRWEPWSAIVLAGGRAARMGGVEKAGIEIRGRTLLAWVLDAVVDARDVVVVGDPVTTERPVTFVREEPRFGGPAAGLLTGFDHLLRPPAYVATVAVDMPYLTPRTFRRLLEAAHGGDGAALVDPDGRRQLAMVVATERLAQVRPRNPEDEFNMSLRALLGSLTLTAVDAEDREHQDIDTWADLRDA